MNATSRTVWSLGILFLAGVLCMGVAQAVAADAPLEPVAEPSPAMAQPPATDQPEASAYQDNVLDDEADYDDEAYYEDEEAEFAGLPLCSPPGRFWLRADYLMWWTNGVQLPPLVTTSPQGTPVAQAGVLGQPGTTILYGNQTIGNDMRSGFHTTVGMWLDPCHIWDLEFDYLSLGERANGYSRTSTGDPILARPFFNLQTNQQSRQLVAYPGVVEGTVSVDAKEYFQSAGVSLSYNLCACDSCYDPCMEVSGPPLLYCCRTDLLAGYRYYGLSDSLVIHENLSQATPPAIFDIQDSFRADNAFHGAEIGLRTKIYRGRWSLQVLTKVALGNTHSTVTIDGQTIIASQGQASQTYNAGILAGYTNSGIFQRDSFTVIPQLGFELGYQWGRHWRTFVGYNVLYWGCISRAADQIDLNLDPRNFPPPQPGGLPFPAFPGDTSCFWAQGVNLGAEFRF